MVPDAALGGVFDVSRILIIGGGLAGLAAAVRLTELDYEVTLLETRKKLGGRATSFVDPRTGDVLDNCQHVLMGCCTYLIDFYDRLGVLDSIDWHTELYWTRGQGLIDRLKPGWLPAPLHFSGSFGRFKSYTRQEKRHLARAMWRMIRLGYAGRLAWRERTFLEFLRECNQPDELIRSYWQVIIVSACNLPVERVSAEAALQVFQEGFLASKWSSAMGLASVPLWSLYDPAHEAIERAGGTVRLGVSVKSINFDGRRATGVVTDEGLIESPTIISAVPFDRLDKLIGPSMRKADARLQRLESFDVSPILGVHLTFDQPVMDLPHLVLIDRAVHWLFNKGTDQEGRQHIHAVISAADAWMPLPEEEIARRVLEDVHHVIPKSRGLEPVRVRAVKEKRATFAAVPGLDRLRPGAAPGGPGSPDGLATGGIPNLFLAGDWCDTGWPATMEGAVRSGYAVAESISGQSCRVSEVPPGMLAAALGLRSGLAKF